ncbi:ABC transporter substrate-binding protein [Pseudonocardia phyllosphaerae]|uniref:ABC transporter substrate-binding protein n=1 Tax=Pseudonocardia phyllosphaerae TaxID=3390502 RepID=UPI00397D2CDA
MLTTRPRRRTAILTAALLSAALVLAGCGGNGDRDSAAAPGGSAPGFPVTVTSDLGEITLQKKPEKVVVMGDARFVDVLASLGEPPAFFGSYQDEKTSLQYYPWLKGQYGKFEPGLATSSGEGSSDPDVEAIGALKPDLIILSTLGDLKDGTRQQLSQIAPLYADDNPETWTKAVTDMGAITGKPQEAQQLIAKGEAEFADARKRLAKLQGKTFFAGFVSPDGSVAPFPEMGLFATKLGLKPASNMPVLPDRGKSISAENRDKIRADVVLAGSVDGDYKKLQSDPRYADLPAVRNRTMLFLEPLGISPSATTAIGPASIPWLLGKVVPDLEKSTLNTGR